MKTLPVSQALIVPPGALPKRRALAYVALIAVCILWGTTYSGIRIAIETIPPLYMIALRYTISGGIMVLCATLYGAGLPRGKGLFRTAVCGIICIGIGNGFLAIAETWVPTGLAALFYTTAPFWMVGLDALLPHGRRPAAGSILGLLVGVAGVVILVLPAVKHEGWHGGTFLGFAVLQLSAAGWTLGALLQKRVATAASPVVVGAVQQLAAGLAMFVPAAFVEPLPHQISTRSAYAVLYLVIFGSLLGFSSFVYAIARLPVALVSIYTFVNPMVAVALGSILFGEPFGGEKLAAMCVIFLGVAIVKSSDAIKVRQTMTARNKSCVRPSNGHGEARPSSTRCDNEDQAGPATTKDSPASREPSI